MKEVLASYDRYHKDASTKLHALDAARWDARVPFMMGGQAVMNETGYDNAWVFCSTLFIIVDSYRLTCVQWALLSRRFTAQARMSPCNEALVSRLVNRID